MERSLFMHAAEVVQVHYVQALDTSRFTVRFSSMVSAKAAVHHIR